MKDWYHRLGIDQGASSTEVAAALDLKPELSACAEILLDDEKREGYDEVHTTLTAIGVMRHSLGLDSGDSWFLENCADFAPARRSARPSGGSRQPPSDDSTHEKIQGVRPQEPEPSTGTRQPLLLITGVVIAIIVLVMLGFALAF